VPDLPKGKALMIGILGRFDGSPPKTKFETRSSGTGMICALSAFTLDSHKRSAGLDATLPGSWRSFALLMSLVRFSGEM
jgi:hypothetical protein